MMEMIERAAFMILTFMVGALVGAIFLATPYPSASPVSPKELTDSERASSYVLVRTFPMSIKLTIVPGEDIERYRGRNVYAFSTPFKTPCEIVMPAGQEIVLRPADGGAIWLSKWVSDTWAHEIAHCMRGNWHPQ